MKIEIMYWLGYVAICYLVTGAVITLVDVIRNTGEYQDSFTLSVVLSIVVIPAVIIYDTVITGTVNVLRKEN